MKTQVLWLVTLASGRVAAQPGAIEEGCPDGWLPHGKSCFKLSASAVSRSNCAVECDPGWLACIEDEDLNDWVIQTFASASVSIYAFLGWTDETSEGTWIPDDECRDATFTRWSAGEPNSGSSYNCAILNLAADPVGYWQDDSCSRSYQCLCQTDYATTKPTASPAPSRSPAPTSTGAPTSGLCPEGWLDFGDDCYRLSTSAMSKYACEANCYPGYLACIESNDENDWIIQTFAARAVTSYFFLGYSDEQSEGVWTSPSECGDSSFAHWAVGEPNSGSSYDCAILNVAVDPIGYWQDDSCWRSYQCLCKLPKTTPKPTITPKPTMTFSPTQGECPDGWRQYGDSCYRLSQFAKSKFACEGDCYPGYLACINSDAENSWILNTFASLSESNYLYLGYTDYYEEGVFVAPAECDFTAESYTNWDVNEPNSGASYDCSIFNLVGNVGLWQDDSCFRAYHCLCKMQAKTLAPTPIPSTVLFAPTTDDSRSHQPTMNASRFLPDVQECIDVCINASSADA
mmetsp:Transcript_3451/g.10664  ORF Transcript_3451/g.10664 Transcript_3451/m.10664 type:complete len:515 (-) Transcript_3451:581-2125(-)|eukprot:CAMPEP_0197395886 /NCGR_PEP_ID=MMETSP1165-20131217/7932_1 /TAXON_ID=284809 /ORGANISM="Chrysocystis fragilis, Strain CCMP3189" /LENGTH=514 /DNA_ID=CAMNT_0042921671 /DNA_START=39 /DNA_END=1583 /DNA_ORIENTATION=+